MVRRSARGGRRISARAIASAGEYTRYYNSPRCPSPTRPQNDLLHPAPVGGAHGADLRGCRGAARRLPGRRSALALDRRHRLARRRRVGAQRPKQGAVQRVDARRMEPGLHRAGVHRARVRLLQGAWCWRAAGPTRVRADGVSLGATARVGSLPGGGSNRGDVGGGAARHQLRLRDVRPGRDDGASMVAFMVASWYFYVRAGQRPRGAGRRRRARCSRSSPRRRPHSSSPRWRVEAAIAWFEPTREVDCGRHASAGDRDAGRRWPSAAPLVLAFFVVPHWTDYRFYNWQMSVTRKPSYDLHSVVNRVTWFPILHDIFTRMWFTLVVGVTAAFGAADPLAHDLACGAAARPLDRDRRARVDRP